jgi:class 3 adenylate cyclase
MRARGQVAGEKLIAQQYEGATIIFSDIVGFTTFSSHVEPSDVVLARVVKYSGQM